MTVKRYHGFTLIELMLTAAIIGILSAIAIPKFANMIIKAKEATVRAHLGSLRSAISIYYADTEGIFPRNGGPFNLRNALTPGSKYLEEIPYISIPTISTHIEKNLSRPFKTFFIDWGLAAPTLAAWGYEYGELIVNCSHADSSGRIWSTW